MSIGRCHLNFGDHARNLPSQLRRTRVSPAERGALTHFPGRQRLQLESPQLLRNVYRPAKYFRPRAEAELLAKIRACGEQGVEALVLSMRRLRTIILSEIRSSLPSVTQVPSSCLLPNRKNKSDEDLQEFKSLGLKVIYAGTSRINHIFLSSQVPQRLKTWV